MADSTPSPRHALEMVVISMRYSSWSMRPWLALTHAGIAFTTRTVEPTLGHQSPADGTVRGGPDPKDDLSHRRALGSVIGLFPVLWVGETPIHESLAICEWAAEERPDAALWPADRLERAQARAISCEMATGFTQLRTHLSCHPFARVKGFEPNAATQAEIDRVHEMWRAALARSGGPFLFGRPSIADFMYFPVVTRFETYGVPFPPDLRAYADAMWALPAVKAWHALAVQGPRIPVYDAYIEGLGGDPDGALRGV